MRIVFFIESLRSGGKERRLLELIHFYRNNSNHNMHLVIMNNIIHYEYVKKWNIPITILERRKQKKDQSIFWKFFLICKKFNPDVIHTWSIMNTFYAIPSKVLLRKPILSSMITSGTSRLKPWTFNKFVYSTSCFFSDLITSNSKAGIEAFQVSPKKSRIIYNGIRMERFNRVFNNSAIREKFDIQTDFIVIMVASMIKIKSYDTYLNLAKAISKIRDDITFVAAGDGDEFERIKQRIQRENLKNVKLIGTQKDIESIINAADVGVLFTNGKEGISNAIMEYMALKKPVIATNDGGTLELLENNKSGFLVSNNSIKEICSKLNKLIDNPEIRNKMGQTGYNTIKNNYSIEKMAASFNQLYNQLQAKG
jgi:glycosyltransferase involved in cell wall biosynthesis